MHEKDQKPETVSKYIEVVCYRFYTWFSIVEIPDASHALHVIWWLKPVETIGL